MSWFALNRFSSRKIGGCRLGCRDQIHASSDEGPNRNPMRRDGSKARQRQGYQRLVRIESPQVKSPRQVGRTRRSEAGVVKTQAPRANSELGKTTPGWEIIGRQAGDRNVIPSGTVEHGCTRVEYVDGSSLVVRISRV